MPLQFDATNLQGNTQPVSVQGLAKALAAKGEEIAGISPDGMSIQVMDEGQPITVPVSEAFQKLGFQVANPRPTDADYSQVSPHARAAITAIGGEDNKIAYLKMLEQRNGNPSPQIIGGGRDFFVFDPQTQKYRALTNNPDWDVSDLAEAGAEAPGAIGATIGAGLGAASGAATAGTTSVPGLMAGAAAGSAFGNSLTKVALGIQDQDARKAMLDSPVRQAAGVAGTAALDAATAGLGSKVPGLMSQTARGAGRVMSGVGRVMGHGAKVVDNEFGRDVVGSMINPVGQGMATAEVALKAPAALTRAANRFPGWLGQQMEKAPAWAESKGITGVLGDDAWKATKEWMTKRAGDLQNYTKRLDLKTDLPSNTRGEMLKNAEKIGGWMGGRKPSSGVTIEDELANLGEYVGGGKQSRDVYHMAEADGMSPFEARTYARNPLGEQWGKVGAKGGRLMDTLDAAGDLAGAVNRGIGGAAIKATRGAGIASNLAGDAMQYGGALTSPLENRFLARYGSEEALRRRRPWQMVPNTSTINPVHLASEE